mgnify:CR=1 FL=1
MSKSHRVDGEDVVAAVSILGAATEPRTIGQALRSAIAGGGAAHVIASSVTLFEAGGKLLLDESAKNALRSAAEKGA